MLEKYDITTYYTNCITVPYTLFMSNLLKINKITYGYYYEILNTTS